jgi:hypothetical protein
MASQILLKCLFQKNNSLKEIGNQQKIQGKGKSNI